MEIRVFSDRRSMGKAAANDAAEVIRRRLHDHGRARIIAATAVSQEEFLEELTRAPDIDWRQVEAFHLDEYIGLDIAHPGSFRKMFLDQLISKTGIVHYHLLGGDNTESVVRQASEAVTSAPIDVAFLGIGENGHLAFNDPPADFDTEEPYLVVTLDEASRRQQVREKWFSDISEVPQRAISMSIRQILKAEQLIVIVPGTHKAHAVRAAFNGELSPMVPASILRTHAKVTVYLDEGAASLLDLTLPFETKIQRS